MSKHKTPLSEEQVRYCLEEYPVSQSVSKILRDWKKESSAKHREAIVSLLKYHQLYSILPYNKIPYEGFTKLDQEFIKYRSAVTYRTWKVCNKLEKPAYCFYTGIRFIDEELLYVNNNDPRKRTVDHKIPVVTCFYKGVPVSEVANIKNLCFALRYVNLLKANNSLKSFLPIAKEIRKKLIESGYPYK